MKEIKMKKKIVLFLKPMTKKFIYNGNKYKYINCRY